MHKIQEKRSCYIVVSHLKSNLMTPKKKVTDLVFFILVIFQVIKRQIALALEKQVRQTNKQTNELKKDRKGES